jgi:hypothetical protein
MSSISQLLGRYGSWQDSRGLEFKQSLNKIKLCGKKLPIYFLDLNMI